VSRRNALYASLNHCHYFNLFIDHLAIASQIVVTMSNYPNAQLY